MGGVLKPQLNQKPGNPYYNNIMHTAIIAASPPITFLYFPARGKRQRGAGPGDEAIQIAYCNNNYDHCICT